MKSKLHTLFLLLLAAPLSGFAAEQLIPAGSLIQCTVSEPKLSSKTADVGDPVLCQISHVELYGRSVLPYGSYLEGRFEDYKDPGHLVGKGWMELKFDKMVIQPDTVIPVAAKVVYVPNYPVDKQGRIHGKGHPVRDIVEWSIPILWPIDLLNLPRRGPRPVLKEETRLTLKIMDDLGVPLMEQAPRDPSGLMRRAPVSYAPQEADPRPMMYSYPAAPPPVMTVPVMPVAEEGPPVTVLVLRDGHPRFTTEYWFEGGTRVRYTAMNGVPIVIPMEDLDLQATVQVNRRRGVQFAIRSAGY